MSDTAPKTQPEMATLKVGDQTFELPVIRDAFGNPAVDISGLFQKSGVMTVDRGFTSTAACESGVTYIDGDAGILLYRGYPIQQIANQCSFLETSYLLLNGELPTRTELDSFRQDIAKHTPVHDQMRSILDRHTRHAHPMTLLQSMATDLGEFYNGDINTPKGRNEIALNLIAKMPIMVAMVYRYSQGKPPIFPRRELVRDDDLGYTANFLRMCFAEDSGDQYEPKREIVEAMDRIFVLHADHEQNASTSTVRLAGSTGTNAYAAMPAGIAALAGPAHGGANEAVLRMLNEIGTIDKVPAFIEQVKQPGNTRLMGFGHRVYKNFDPRAGLIKEDCDKVLDVLGVNDPRLAIARELEQTALNDPYFKSKKLYPNVDFYSGIILSAVGFKPEMFTPLFALARTVGWAVQWKEQAEGKLVIGRPRQVYTGHPGRDVIPMEQRAAPAPDGSFRDAAASVATTGDRKQQSPAP